VLVRGRVTLLLVIHLHVLFDVLGGQLLPDGLLRDELLVRGHHCQLLVQCLHVVLPPYRIQLLVLHMLKVLLFKENLSEFFFLLNSIKGDFPSFFLLVLDGEAGTMIALETGFKLVMNTLRPLGIVVTFIFVISRNILALFNCFVESFILFGAQDLLVLMQSFLLLDARTRGS
jgi:hypothetical protein